MPYAVQPHPELNIAGAALKISATIKEFVKDKIEKATQGLDQGGYQG